MSDSIQPWVIDPTNSSGAASNGDLGTPSLPDCTIAELIRRGFHRKGFRLRTLREGVLRLSLLGFKDG